MLEKIYGRWSRGADPHSFREGKERGWDGDMGRRQKFYREKLVST